MVSSFSCKTLPAIFNRAQQHAEVDTIEALRFYMFHLHYAEVGDEWNTGAVPRCDGSHYIHFVCRGEARIRWSSGKLRLLPGQAYWLPSHVPVHAHAIGQYCHYFLAFRCSWHALPDLFWDWPTPICLGPWESASFVSAWGKPPLSTSELWRIHACMQRMFAENFPPIDDVIRRANTLHARFENVLSLINRPADARVRVRDLAKSEYMTTNAFSRLFQIHFGVSPKYYLNQRLNQEICQLLASTNLPIKQIAEKLHFTDEYYFNRFFHKMNNISPARYRRRFLSTEPGDEAAPK